MNAWSRFSHRGKQIALESQLGNLYRDALKQLFQDEDQGLFQRVFGAMTVLQQSLPPI